MTGDSDCTSQELERCQRTGNQSTKWLDAKDQIADALAKSGASTARLLEMLQSSKISEEIMKFCK